MGSTVVSSVFVRRYYDAFLEATADGRAATVEDVMFLSGLGAACCRNSCRILAGLGVSGVRSFAPYSAGGATWERRSALPDDLPKAICYTQYPRLPKSATKCKTPFHRTTYRAICLALYEGLAFDSTTAVCEEFILSMLKFNRCSIAKARDRLHKALDYMTKNGLVEYVYADGRVPQPGKEDEPGDRLYFLDREELEESGAIQLKFRVDRTDVDALEARG